MGDVSAHSGHGDVCVRVQSQPAGEGGAEEKGGGDARGGERHGLSSEDREWSATFRTAQEQARALQRKIDNAELAKRNEAFVSQSARDASCGQPAWLAFLGAGAAPTPPSLTAPEPPSEGAWRARHTTPETIAPPVPEEGTAARHAPLSLAQQQRAFIDGLGQALRPSGTG